MLGHTVKFVDPEGFPHSFVLRDDLKVSHFKALFEIESATEQDLAMLDWVKEFDGQPEVPLHYAFQVADEIKDFLTRSRPLPNNSA